MDKITFKHLLKSYIDGSLSPAEWSELSVQLRLAKHDKELQQAIDEALKDKRFEQVIGKARADDLFHKIMDKAAYKEKSINPVTKKRWLGPVAAAAVIFLMVATGWLWYLINTAKKTETLQNPVAQNKDDIIPGGNKAILTLANGVSVILDSAHNGVVAQQGNTKVIKVNSGLLSYNRQQTTDDPSTNSGQRRQQTIQHNTIVTPRGGQYKLILPDGTKVWLNAVSSLHYPVRFSDNERKVTLTGEAYFEVTKNAEKPFKVYVSSADGEKKGVVQVLGTHFNINAYDEEPSVKTTLLEGKIKVSDKRATVILSPGQQAVQFKDGKIILRKNVNLNEPVAWKNGLFLFDHTDIKTVMRRIARWYDIEVICPGNIHARLSGMISRNTNLSQTLKMLELTREVHFKIEGRNVTVMP